MDSNTPPPNMVGVTLGKYKLTKLLGSGGMAEVYEAVQVGLDRSVAIKVMHQHMARDTSFKERFQREAKMIASLRHPNIVQIYDFDVDNNWYYMVMEHVDGGTLTDRLHELHKEEKIMPLADAYKMFITLGSALNYAHELGMIHRDIKPDNIMFTSRGDPILMDFGIARIMDGTKFTMTGAIIGTPAYMSPEQATGESVDERSDIYSLGVLFYEITTGQLPYEADTPFGLLMKHVSEPFIAPREINPDLPLPVVTVLEKVLAKNPDDRYQTANEFVVALKAARDGKQEAKPSTVASTPIASPPPVPPKDVSEPESDRSATINEKAIDKKPLPFVKIAVAIAALLLVVGAIFIFSNTSTSDENDVVANTPSNTTPSSTEETYIADVVETETASPNTPTLSPSLEPTQINTLVPTPTVTPESISAPLSTSSSLSGRLLYVSNKDGDFEIYLKNLGDDNRSDVPLTNNEGIDDQSPDWSPDGRKIVFSKGKNGAFDLYIMNPNGTDEQVFVETSGWDEYGEWTSDSREIIFSTTAETDGSPNSELFRRDSYGTLIRLTHNKSEERDPNWHPDGDIYFASNAGGKWSIQVLSLFDSHNGPPPPGDGPPDGPPGDGPRGDGPPDNDGPPDGGSPDDEGPKPRRILEPIGADKEPALSPNNKRLLFIRVEVDTNKDGIIDAEDMGNIYTMNLDGSNLRAITTDNRSASAIWSYDAQWIAYAQPVDDDPEITALYAIRLSDGQVVTLLEGNGYTNWSAAWVK